MILRQKDIMWHIKAWSEAIQIFIFLVCLIGFIASFIIMMFDIPDVWGKPITYRPHSWSTDLMGWCMSVGLINFLFLISRDKDWRRDYRDEEDADEFD